MDKVKRSIPRIIHQTYSSSDIPDEFIENIENLKSNNEGWEYRFYNERDRSIYIRENYGEEIFKVYNSINPNYGAARADLFRYLVIYRDGGVYLDIKSSCAINLDELIDDNDEFFLSHWPNNKGEVFEGAGIFPELNYVHYGEFQQWYIISKPNSYFLKVVIDRVINNIENYNPWRHGVSKIGVLRLTGPIPYTQAIFPIISKNDIKVKYARNHYDFKLIYSILDCSKSHELIMKNHYSLCSEPIILPDNKIKSINYKFFIFFRFINRIVWFKDKQKIKFLFLELMKNLRRF